MYNNHTLIKAFKGSGAIAANVIVKFGAADDVVSPAAASTDLLIGVANSLGLSAADQTAGATVDVVLGGIAEVKLGGTVTRGNYITSDASGQGVAAAPAAGVNASVIGMALKSGVSGDIIPVALSQSRIQG